MSGEGEGCIHIVWNAREAFRDATGVIGVQDTILEAPVLTSLKGVGKEEGGEEVAGWAQRQSPQSKPAVSVLDLSPRTWNLGLP